MSAHGYPKARPYLQVRQEILCALSGPLSLRELYTVVGRSVWIEQAAATLLERGEIQRCGTRRSMDYGTEDLYKATNRNQQENALAILSDH
jgi:hypothetical protein